MNSKAMTGRPVLDPVPDFSRTVKFKDSEVTAQDILNRHSQDASFVCRVICEQLGFSCAYMGQPMFNSRTPSLDGVDFGFQYVEAWRGDVPYFSRVSDAFMKLTDQVFCGATLKTCSERFVFHKVMGEV